MAFQFLCPQGHLLQGEESQAGMQCQCPYCQSLFLIPPPNPPAPPTFQPPPAFQPPPSYLPPGSSPPGGTPAVGGAAGSEASGVGPSGVVAPTFAPSGGPPAIVHILCPTGHELETPREMLGQEALCPYCQVQFRLRYEDSLEYRKEQAEEIERRERRLAKLWLQWSIGIAVVVVLGVIILSVLAASL